ncbi:MAG: TetR/AcrR family transcriptional regulator [Propionibacteriaceae bacterium]|jgi:AcrR family transcriptional regulator|nr:TetR/AcrR family transcriptional regulator [Propionibacteriaceae bacterium]
MSTAHPDDRTARARIRDAALFCFARDGFAAPLRVIAEVAGVSVPLITHHYGTKDALRQTCDDYVLERYADLKLLAIQQPSTVGATLDDSADISVIMVYVMRCFLDAAPAARTFFDHFVEQTRTVFDAARAAGMVNPAPDEEERLRVLAAQAIGSLLVQFAIDPPADPRRFIDQSYNTRAMLAQLDLYTHPVLVASATKSYLDSLEHRQ